jgi:hypothetical protein
MTPSLPAGQSTPFSIKDAREIFNAELVVKNNDQNADPGVHDVLNALNHDDLETQVKKIKAHKEIKKDQLVAAWGFLQDKTFTEAKEAKCSKDFLTQDVIKIYNHISPTKCDQCQKIYKCYKQFDSSQCFLCFRSMCPDCCPAGLEADKAFLTTVFPICFPCADSHRSGAGAGRQAQPKAPEATQDSMPSQQDLSLTQEPSQEDMEGFTVVASGRKNSKAIDSAKESAKAASKDKDNHCRFFLRGACKFGSRGAECNFLHPKICHKWMKEGTAGCDAGSDCEYLHPRMCSSSLKGVQCVKDKCHHNHIKKLRTKKAPTGQKPAASNLPQGKPKSREARPARASHQAEARTQEKTQGFQEASLNPPPDPMADIRTCLKDLMEQVAFLSKESQSRMQEAQAQAKQAPRMNPWWSGPPASFMGM